MRKRRPYRLLRVRLDPSLRTLLASSAQDEAPRPGYGWKEYEAAVAAWEKMVSAG